MTKQVHNDTSVMFSGYPSPSSNTTHTPNQFFDVVLPYSSRGVVRLVSYLIRRTLGWCDENGNPVDEQVSASFNDFIEGAGVARGSLKKAINEAIEARFIRCVREGRPKLRGQSAVSALYELNWDEEAHEYVKDPKLFQGFFAGNGNYTYIPNAYFDFTIRYETLAVTKVVGAIIRNTIGFQTKRGFRRQQVAMSFSDIQIYTRINSRRTFNEALKYALEKHHITLVQGGKFGGSVRASKYGICWMDKHKKDAELETSGTIGSKRIPEKTGDSDRSVQKGYQRERFKKDTSDPEIGSKRIPESVQKGYQERFKKDTSHIVNKTLNKTSKQQQGPIPPSEEDETVVVEEVFVMESFRLLREGGLDETTALEFAKTYPPDRIQRQCEYLPKRAATKNKAGMLRRSIEGNWDPPEEENSPVSEFAKSFYAELNGNKKSALAPISSNDLRAAEPFAYAVLEIKPILAPRELARLLIKFTNRYEPAESKISKSLRATLTHYADRFVVFLQKQEETRVKKNREASKKAHREKNDGKYEAYLHEAEKALKRANLEAYEAFSAWESKDRSLYDSPNKMVPPSLQKRMLKEFDTPEAHTRRFFDFFTKEYQEKLVYTFWEWDRELNPSPLPAFEEAR